MQVQCSYSKHTLYSSINRLYAQNPVFEIVREESVKVYLHMYSGNIEQNPLCVKSCVTNEISISPRFSPTKFDPDGNSRPCLNVLTESVNKICRQNLSKIKLCDWPNKLDATSWQV